jgi:hypothetical protein
VDPAMICPTSKAERNMNFIISWEAGNCKSREEEEEEDVQPHDYCRAKRFDVNM